MSALRPQYMTTQKCIALVTLFSIEYAINPHGFDIEETDYDIISSDLTKLCSYWQQAGIYLARSSQRAKFEGLPRSKTAAYILMGSAELVPLFGSCWDLRFGQYRTSYS